LGGEGDEDEQHSEDNAISDRDEDIPVIARETGSSAEDFRIQHERSDLDDRIR
jgi:hypothetical protein